MHKMLKYMAAFKTVSIALLEIFPIMSTLYTVTDDSIQIYFIFNCELLTSYLTVYQQIPRHL